MMVTTSFLSMWLSNTASTAMMLPIASAILKSLFGQREARKDLPREGDESTGEAGQAPGPHRCWAGGHERPTGHWGRPKVHASTGQALWAECFNDDS